MFGIALLLFVGAAPAGAGETYPNPDPPSDTQVQRSTLEQEQSLPRTGSDIAPWAITGVVLVGLGGGLVYLTRRRNHEDAALSA